MFSTGSTERLVKALSTARESHSEQGAKKPPAPASIAISREVGALGTTVAQALGQRLGWEVYDQELVQQLAETLETNESDIEGLDERTLDWLEEMFAAFLSNRTVSPYSYLKYLIATVKGIGEQGHSIIVGRGAHCILPEESTLRVRLVAALPDRIRTIADRRSLSEEQAARWIEEHEESRREFIRESFGRDLDDPLEYDILLNTSRLKVETCVAIIVDALRSIDPKFGK